MTPKHTQNEATSPIKEVQQNMANSPLRDTQQDKANSPIPSFYPAPFAPYTRCLYTPNIFPYEEHQGLSMFKIGELIKEHRRDLLLTTT